MPARASTAIGVIAGVIESVRAGSIRPTPMRRSLIITSSLALAGVGAALLQPPRIGLQPMREATAAPQSQPQGTLSAALVATTAAAACAKPKAVKLADAWRTCEWDGKSKKPVACAKYGPVLSDRCTAEATRSKGITIDYDHFGEVDCRSNDRKDAVTRIVIHNGDSGDNNNENWKCRPSAAHYTVDRDGTIHQHIGEERTAWHAVPENHDTIGIELEIKRKYGGTCNSLPNLSKTAAKYGIQPEDVVADLCAPSHRQYEALAKLIADIKTRHTIADDGIFGHCEVQGTDHGDPKAFDWARVGARQRKAINACEWYLPVAVRTTVVGMMPKSGKTWIELDAGSSSQVEVGDHGWLENANEETAAWFVITDVEADKAFAIVALPFSQMSDNLAATIVAKPGNTPPALGAATKPALGSCETDYTYHKTGTIKSWTTGAGGAIATLTLDGVGWKHRVCDDATGLVYLGASGDTYVTDAAGSKLRFRMTKVDETTAVAQVIEGSLTEKELGANRRVVVRAKK